MTRRITAARSLAAALVAATAACSSTDEPTPRRPRPARTRSTAGVIAIVDVAPIYLGKQKGFFTKHNIDLTLETAQGGAVDHPGRGRRAVRVRLQQRRLAAAGAVAGRCRSRSSATATTPPATRPRTSAASSSRTRPSPARRHLEGKKVATNTLNNIVDTTDQGDREEGRRRPVQGVLCGAGLPRHGGRAGRRPGRRHLRRRAVPVRGQGQGLEADRRLRRRRPEAVRGALLHLAGAGQRPTPTWSSGSPTR